MYNIIFILLISFCLSNILYIINYIFFKRDIYFQEIKLKYNILNLLNFIINFIIVLNFSFNFQSLIYCILFSILILLSFIDIKHKIIPNKIFIAFIFLIFANILFCTNINIFNIILGSLSISVPLLIISIITNGFGGGDIKLYFFLGFLLGIEKVILSFIFATITAGIFSIYFIIKYKNSKKIIPFVPFIFIGTFISIILNNK